MGGHETAINHHAQELDIADAEEGDEPVPLINRIDMRDLPTVPRGDAVPGKHPDAGQTRHESVTVDGIERDYWVHLPKNYDPNQKLPLVLVFNGYASSGRQLGDVAPGGAGMEELTGLSQKADQEGFIVAYLDGNPDSNHTWNNGQWWFSKRNDIKFTGRVIDKLQENYGTDPSRTYLAGFSQGASFVHRAVSEMPDRIAAIADVSGWMSGQEKRTAAGIPMIALQSVDDPTVPYEGRKWWLTMKPEIHTSRHYRDINDIETVTPKVHIMHQPDGRMVKDRTYTDPQSGVEIRTILVEKEGHVWFGGKGAENSQINATNLVWDFFKKHQKGNAGGVRENLAEPSP
jgi:polyhydroxybutyrate depolymerase